METKRPPSLRTCVITVLLLWITLICSCQTGTPVRILTDEGLPFSAYAVMRKDGMEIRFDGPVDMLNAKFFVIVTGMDRLAGLRLAAAGEFLLLRRITVAPDNATCSAAYSLPRKTLRSILIESDEISLENIRSFGIAADDSDRTRREGLVIEYDLSSGSQADDYLLSAAWTQDAAGKTGISVIPYEKIYEYPASNGPNLLSFSSAVFTPHAGKVFVTLPLSSVPGAFSAAALPRDITAGGITPLPADPAMVLMYDQSRWRQPDWELFSWLALPDVLIFDFRDYAVQNDFFLRLGFFSDVAGEQGRLYPLEYYGGRHGYNAHDYRPETLAGFFNTAASQGTPLTAGENYLRELCMAHGIVKTTADGYEPGTGAVVSVSRETASALRVRLLRHECSHGLFFVAPAYRPQVESIWNGLDGREREFWRIFLGNKGNLDLRPGYAGYDAADEYLMINEMQAHVMQLERTEIDDYFISYYAGQIKRILPEYSRFVSDFIRDYPDSFTRLRTKLENAMISSLPAGTGLFSFLRLK